MYVDSSRLKTLTRIHKDLHDFNTPMQIKRNAHRLRAQIQKDVHDHKLSKLREQLARAVTASDKYETWKLTCQIKDHMGEEIPTDIYERHDI